ncbi:MAG: hypothetical protein HON44_01145, partial [Glaciecola sp.]|nr:hypothetical protein [Glaciecola sp.]
MQLRLTGTVIVLQGLNMGFNTKIKRAAALILTLLVAACGGESGQTPSPVAVTATELNLAPIANAGADQSSIEGLLITLNGSLSTDPNGD